MIVLWPACQRLNVCHTREVDARSQFHPVTVQWLAPNGKIGWIQLTRCTMIDAGADKAGITISADGDVEFRIDAPDITASQAVKQQWTLAGLTVHVSTDAKGFSAVQDGPFVDVKYTGITWEGR